MTTSTDRPDEAHLFQHDDRDNSQIRRLRLVAIVLAILALALGAVIVATAVAGDDDGGATSAPDDVIQLVEDFTRAFEEQDDELVQSVITEDFSSTTDVYKPDSVKPAFTAGMTPDSLTYEIRTLALDVERSGDLLVAGDGPWVVAARETWSNRFNQDEGVRVYVIVDEDGTPKISGFHFVGIKYDVMPDFGD